jgi:hypothetical protein
MTETKKKNSGDAATTIVVHPQALIKIASHGVTHRHAEIHGIWVGRRRTTTTTKMEITDAIPVCHGAPTRILVETALGLYLIDSEDAEEEDKGVVCRGWYTAPALLNDAIPGPTALRMASNLDHPEPQQQSSSSSSSALLVLQNAKLREALLQGNAQGIIQGYGKDFAGQFLEKIDTQIIEPGMVARAILAVKERKVNVCDLLDHMEDMSKCWHHANQELTQIINEHVEQK